MKRNLALFAVVALIGAAAAAGVLPPDVLLGLAGVPMCFGNVQTAAGATLKVASAAPATFDAAGYAAVFAVSPHPPLVGEITDFGEFGRSYNLVKHNPVASRGTQKYKGSFDEGSVALKLGLDNKDAGQLAMQAASKSDNTYYFEIDLQNGDKYYFAAKVMDFKVGVGGVDGIVSANTTLELTTNSAGVGIISSPAA